MPQRIVVIDDAPAIVDLYEDLLTSEGYTVVATFARPPTDPDEVANFYPDLIIMDWFFDREGAGRHILEILRAHPATAAIPIIVCTAAQKSLNDMQDILTQRGVRVIHKPFAIDDLVATVEQVLARKQVVDS